MTTDKEHICRFLHAQHVLTLGTCWEGEMWCANCFYVFDEECMALYFMTETRTRHGGMLLKILGSREPSRIKPNHCADPWPAVFWRGGNIRR